MIVDDLRAASPAFKSLTQGAQIIRVPWPVCPLTTIPDGKLGINWTGFGGILQKLIPLAADGSSIDTSWWRPPFERMVIVSEKNEAGCLLVLNNSDPKLMQDSAFTDSAWSCAVGLIALYEHPTTKARVTCLMGTNVYSVGGFLLDVPQARAYTTVLLQEHLEKREHGSLHDLAERIQQSWADQPADIKLDMENITATFATTMALLNCKNIKTEPIRPDERLQRARVKRGALPLVSWHILKVGVGKARAASQGGSTGHGEPLALHWVRGHFKRYTAERPLLGRAVGTYWWTPHLAGKADRVVHKDYQIEE